jgi:hypothetical protein
MATAELRHRCDDCGLAMVTHCNKCDWQKGEPCRTLWSERYGFRREKERVEDGSDLATATVDAEMIVSPESAASRVRVRVPCSG